MNIVSSAMKCQNKTRTSEVNRRVPVLGLMPEVLVSVHWSFICSFKDSLHKLHSSFEKIMRELISICVIEQNLPDLE